MYDLTMSALCTWIQIMTSNINNASDVRLYIQKRETHLQTAHQISYSTYFMWSETWNYLSFFLMKERRTRKKSLTSSIAASWMNGVRSTLVYDAGVFSHWRIMFWMCSLEWLWVFLLWQILWSTSSSPIYTLNIRHRS